MQFSFFRSLIRLSEFELLFGNSWASIPRFESLGLDSWIDFSMCMAWFGFKFFWVSRFVFLGVDSWVGFPGSAS